MAPKWGGWNTQSTKAPDEALHSLTKKWLEYKEIQCGPDSTFAADLLMIVEVAAKKPKSEQTAAMRGIKDAKRLREIKEVLAAARVQLRSAETSTGET